MDKKVVIFSGPAGCGKDTAVRACISGIDYKFKSEKITDCLKNAVHKLFELKFDPIYLDMPEHAHEKDIPLVSLFGRTPRQAYIEMSNWIKEQYGSDILGAIKANSIKKDTYYSCHIFSDGAFADELLPVVDLVGPKNVLIVHILAIRDRKQVTFSSTEDSRTGYLSFPNRPVTVRTIQNDMDDPEGRALFLSMTRAVVSKFLGV
jgi:hypothetical protein